MKHGRDCPDRCSQCLGATPKRVVLLDGDLYVDGVHHGVLAEQNRERSEEEQQAGRPARMRKRRCGRCRKPGHNAKTCTEQLQDDAGVN